MKNYYIGLALLMAAMFISNVSYAQPKAVDLGLSVKWADRNIGASAPEEYGGLYAWGETKIKTDYSWATYKWCLNREGNRFSKYVTERDYGSTDYKTTLEKSDDAARANWGGGWRMPTQAEFEELKSKCTWEWTRQGGHEGYKVTGPNGKSIFLPAAGIWRYRRSSAGFEGYYWSSTLYTDEMYRARYLSFNSGTVRPSDIGRFNGLSIRPVKE